MGSARAQSCDGRGNLPGIPSPAPGGRPGRPPRAQPPSGATRGTGLDAHVAAHGSPGRRRRDVDQLHRPPPELCALPR
eukprot:2874238-Heterocapsa_arctica.AAC.1